jgi:hypothetical protein
VVGDDLADSRRALCTLRGESLTIDAPPSPTTPHPLHPLYALSLRHDRGRETGDFSAFHLPTASFRQVSHRNYNPELILRVFDDSSKIGITWNILEEN